MGWSGHRKTGRLQGIVAKPSTKTLETEGAWAKAIDWMMADFGYRKLPYLPSRSFGCGKQRSTVLGATLLPEERTNNPGGKPKALPAAPRGSRPQNATTINRACGVDLAQREDVGNRKATLEAFSFLVRRGQ